MTKKVKFKQLQGHVDDILCRIEALERITDALQKPRLKGVWLPDYFKGKELRDIICHLVVKHDIREGTCGTCSKAVEVSKQTELVARGSQK